jgi:heat shock protein HtpX
MAHVGNRDTLIMAVVATIAGAISMLAFMAQMSAIFGGLGGNRDRGGNIVGLVIIAIIMPIAASLVRMAISRTREFQADATGARTSGNAYALASALEKLEAGSRARPLQVAEGASHLFIVNPLSARSMAHLFSSHPPIAERVRRLRESRASF